MSGLLSCSSQTPEPQLRADDWLLYQSHFITNEGRVVDNISANASHSESQAYGMFFAVAFNDRDVFDKIWDWTRSNLQVRQQDALLAWLWHADQGEVADLNNATDGDLVAAWALARAAVQWGNQQYATEAKRILSDLSGLHVHRYGMNLLLPASEGFADEKMVTVNPSYMVIPAYRELANIDPQGPWKRLEFDAVNVMREAYFGQWELPADWLDITEQGMVPASSKPKWFSYDAIRVPLFAAWSGIPQPPQRYGHFWQQYKLPHACPDRVDLETDFIHYNEGFQACDWVAGLSQHVLNPDDANISFPQIQWHENIAYYDVSLMLFTQLAWLEFDRKRKLQLVREQVK